MSNHARSANQRLLPLMLVALALLTPTTATAAEPSQQPVRLTIPAVGVDAPVLPVGLSAARRMVAPSDRATVGWYHLGTTPGGVGNAVMSGHLDTAAGEPAVFWSLSELPVGSEILVTTAAGSVLRYHASGLVSYLSDQLPMREIFGPTSASRLNLITCAGTLSDATGLYDHRLVVYADFAGGAPPDALPPAQPPIASPSSVSSPDANASGGSPEPAPVVAPVPAAPKRPLAASRRYGSHF